MFVSLAEVPRVETETVRMSNNNGTWLEHLPRPVNRLGIEFMDADVTGQTVTINRTWLGSHGLTEPFFQYEDGTRISNTSDEHHFYLHPSHFSILYVFTNSDGFWKEDYQPYSDVYRDSVNRNIYVLSDRRDETGTNERVRSPAPVTYDQTTSFKLRATWKTSQQGNWQSAVPVFFMGSGNTRVDMANSVYVWYYSRDSNLGYSPHYYLRYHDGAGNMRKDHLVYGTANVQYEFLFSYDAYTRVMSFALLNSLDNSVGSTTYTVGSGETFSLGKVGAAAWGASNTNEPKIIAKTDNIFLEANMARNGNFETDSNSDGIPDQWQVWIWSDACAGCITRSSSIKKFGTWSVKIQDSSSFNDYGLQTVRMSVNPGETYTGSAWVYESSGWNQLCLEFWDSSSGGIRKGVVCKSASTWLEWEFIDVTTQVPAGAYYADMIVYSSGANTGTGYFDGAELKRSRAFWSVHVHTNHVPNAATWGTVLDYVTDLGITSIRIDFVWGSFMPNSPSVDENHAVYWDQAIRVARARGIGVVAILDGHAPYWALCLITEELNCYPGGEPDYDTYFAEWRRFARIIAARYGQDVQYYQLLNEENHPSHSLYAHEHETGEPRAFYEAYVGLVEGTGLTFATHKSRFKTIVNAFADPGGDEFTAWLRDILNDPWGRDSIDVVAIDHYPGTWCCGSNYRDWAALDALSSIARDYGKEMAVMETGFSSWTNPQGQEHQEQFVNEALDEVFIKAASNNLNYPLSAFVLVSWYELIDACSNCWGVWPWVVENHFGILASVPLWGQKLAYDNLRYQVSRWA